MYKLYDLPQLVNQKTFKILFFIKYYQTYQNNNNQCTYKSVNVKIDLVTTVTVVLFLNNTKVNINIIINKQ